MKLTNLLATLVCVAALTACPEPGTGGGTGLVGTWEEVLAPGSSDVPETVTFRGDGTFEQTDEFETTTGTYTNDAETLTLSSSSGQIQELPFALAGNRFTPIGFTRDIPAESFTGNWRAEGLNDGEPVLLTLDLNEDFTMQLDFGTDAQMSGTWRDQSGTLITTLEIVDGESGQPIPFDLPWHSIGPAVSLFVFERR